MIENLRKWYQTGRPIILRGPATAWGAELEAKLVLCSDGRYLRELKGQLNHTIVNDGRNCWEKDFSGQVRLLELGESTLAQTTTLALTGNWLSEDPTSLQRLIQNGDELSFRRIGGIEEIEIRDKTNHEIEITVRAGDHKHQTSLSGKIQLDGLILPSQINWAGPQAEQIECRFRSIAFADELELAELSEPQSSHCTEYDQSSSPELTVVRAPTGHLLVRPFVNGELPGWFIFDSGAGTSVIHAATADRLALNKLGQVPALGAGGTVTCPLRRAEKLRLGPLTLFDPIMAQTDLLSLTGPLGHQIDGIIGYDLISQAVVDLDYPNAKISLHPIGLPSNDSVEWYTIKLPDRVPTVEACFEDHRGWFRIDTGAPGGAVLFNHPAVRRLNLLVNRELEPTGLPGVGGVTPAQSAQIRSFRIGDRQWVPIDAVFATESQGAFADPYLTGIVSISLFDEWTVRLDYNRRRIGLMEK